MLLLRLGFFWTLGLLSFFFFITFYFQKFSVYLLWSVIKTATDIKPGNVNSNIFFPQAEKTQLCATSAQSQKKMRQSTFVFGLAW